jgi:hypothetical protein
VTISQVLGSIVCSITSVSARPPSVRPTRSRRLAVLPSCGLRTVTWALRGSCRASPIEIPRAPRVNLALDEELIRRIREQDQATTGKSDAELVESALAVHLALKTLDNARAQGTLDPDEADRLAVEETRSVRRALRRV